jgi:hypothetical protein
MTSASDKEKKLTWHDMKLKEFQEAGIVFRLAGPEDAPALVKFHNDYYGTQRTPEHWLWEYQVYAPDKAAFAIAERDGVVLATTAAIPIYMEVAGETALACKGENSLCATDYRGTGLLQALGRFGENEVRKRQYQFHTGISSFEFGRDRLITVFRGLEVWIRPANTWLGLRTKLRAKLPFLQHIDSPGQAGTQGDISLPSLAIDFLLNRHPPAVPQIEKRSGYEIKKGRTPDDELLKLRERLRSKNQNVIWIKYDNRFLDWRVRGNPFINYDEYQAYQHGRLSAYAFVTPSKGEACISDVLSEDEHATSLLLSRIIEEYSMRVSRFRFMGNPLDLLSRDLFRQLPRFGFSRSMRWILSMGDLVGGASKEFYDIDNWHINGLWTEGFHM